MIEILINLLFSGRGGENEMRRIITTFGILAISITILISGSVVGAYWAVDVDSYQNVVNPYAALGGPDGNKSSLGDYQSSELGWIILYMGENPIPEDTDFQVHSTSQINETYKVRCLDIRKGNPTDWWDGYDTGVLTFHTPATERYYYYVEIHATSGVDNDDPHWGPEIDAVGWDV